MLLVILAIIAVALASAAIYLFLRRKDKYTGKWDCNPGSGKCHPDPTGPYDSKEDCLRNRKSACGKNAWDCSPGANKCRPDPWGGPYESEEDCLANSTCGGKIPPNIIPPTVGVPDFLLGGWSLSLQGKDIFDIYAEAPCFNFIEFYESGASAGAGSNLRGSADKINAFRARGGILVASREIALEANAFECQKIFSRPEADPGPYTTRGNEVVSFGSQRAWSDNIRASGVPVDGIMFDYEMGNIQKPDRAWTLDCIETLVKYYNDNPDAYCGEKRIIFFSFGAGLISEGDHPYAERAIERLVKIASYPNVQVFYEFQKYPGDAPLEIIASNFMGSYGPLASRSTFVMYSGAFKQYSGPDYAAQIAGAKNQGLRGLSFLNEPPMGVDADLVRALAASCDSSSFQRKKF